MTTPQPLIFSKMATILSEVSHIGKDRSNQAQGFKFRGIDDVMNELHSLFAKNRIFLTTDASHINTMERPTKSGGTSIHQLLDVRFTFYAEDGSNVTTKVVGEAADSGDKATNKALSVALKYALLQAFMIPTEEAKDPDAESHDFEPRRKLEEPPKGPSPEMNDDRSPKTAARASKPSERFTNGKWELVVVHWGSPKFNYKGRTLGDLRESEPQAFRFLRTVWQPKPYNGTISGQDLDLRAALDVAHAEYEEAKSNGVQEDSEPELADADIPF